MSAPPLPRVVRWLIARTAPDDTRDFLLDDLGEEYTERQSHRGNARALAWLLSQTARSLGPLATTRLRVRRAELAHISQGDPVFTQLRDDLRYSLRVALRRPWLSLTIIATMVLGIGTTTAVFSVIDALLLRPLAFPKSEQLVQLASPLKDAPFVGAVNFADASDVQRETRSLSSLGLFDVSGAILQQGAEPERVSVVQAGTGFGETLRLRPILG